MSRRVQPGAGAPQADSPDLVTMPDSYYRAFVAGYSNGFEHGYVRGLDELDASDDAMWAELARQVRKQAASPRFSQLADRRGDHEAADRSRDWQREHGMAPL